MEECLLLHPSAPEGAIDSVVAAADAAAGEWRPGATFPAAILPANPGIQTKEPEEPSRLRCSVTTRPPVLLKYGDLFLRRQDGMVYRVLSDSRDTMTPATSGLCMAQCRAERWGAWPGVTWPSEGL